MIQYQSISHHNTSLSLREAHLSQFGREITGPSVFLLTCNRVEVYYGDGDVPDDVARHLFRVVCGLESAIVGERAVQGQVKEAYINARQSQKLPAGLHKLFECALQIGKKVRMETEISHGAVSHSLAAVEILEQDKIDIATASVAIIGVNKLTDDIIKFLKKKGCKHICLANRTQGKAEETARQMGIETCQWSELKKLLSTSDILITATSAAGTILGTDDFTPGHQIVVTDLAFPRDVATEVAEIDGVTLYNLHDVEQRVKSNIMVREEEVKKAEVMIEEEIEELRQIMQRRQSRTHDTDN